MILNKDRSFQWTTFRLWAIGNGVASFLNKNLRRWKFFPHTLSDSVLTWSLLSLQSANKLSNICINWRTRVHFDGKDLLITTKEATDYLRISEETFIEYVGLGRIKAIKAGEWWRIPQSELNRFLKGHWGRWRVPTPFPVRWFPCRAGCRRCCQREAIRGGQRQRNP